MEIDYLLLKRLEDTIENQIEVLNFMAKLIAFDDQYVAENPTEELPPLVNVGVLRSHFITQKKACEGVLSLTARHLPRLKAEHDQKLATEREKRKADVKVSPKKTGKKSNVNLVEIQPLDPDSVTESVNNTAIKNPQEVSLWEGFVL